MKMKNYKAIAATTAKIEGDRVNQQITLDALEQIGKQLIGQKIFTDWKGSDGLGIVQDWEIIKLVPEEDGKPAIWGLLLLFNLGDGESEKAVIDKFLAPAYTVTGSGEWPDDGEMTGSKPKPDFTILQVKGSRVFTTDCHIDVLATKPTRWQPS